MKRLIFVDDEPNILQALQRMLRPLRHDYDLLFAGSGKEALQLMEQNHVDAVITDMLMPGMDGAELLTKVQEQYPHTIRIMLTGQADMDSVLRTVTVAHQFLAKPCDPASLKQILLRTMTLQDLLTDGELKNAVSQLKSLPTLPSTYQELHRAMTDPEVSVRDISAIIEKDVAMCAKIMQLVNSAFFGLFTAVESPMHAVSLLGLETIRALVLGVGIFSQFDLPSAPISVDGLWSHSLLVGKIAEKIAKLENQGKETVANCLVAGILHDVGKLVLMANLAERYTATIQIVKEKDLSLTEAEQQALFCTHADIGAFLAGLWGFENEVVEAVAFHNVIDGCPITGFAPVAAVYAANAIYYETRPEECLTKKIPYSISKLESVIDKEDLTLWRQEGQTLLTECLEMDEKE